MTTTLVVPYTRAKSLEHTIWYGAARMTFLATSEDTDGQLAIVEIEGRRGTEPPRHVHSREDESVYVLAGEVEFHVGEERFRVGPGGFVFMPREVPHEFRILTETFKAILVITPGGFENYFKRMGRPAESFELPALQAPSDSFIDKVIQVSRDFGLTMLTR